MLVTALGASEQVSGHHQFRSRGFNVMTCNKIAVVLGIMEQFQLSVVFSDADNVFAVRPGSRSPSLPPSPLEPRPAPVNSSTVN